MRTMNRNECKQAMSWPDQSSDVCQTRSTIVVQKNEKFTEANPSKQEQDEQYRNDHVGSMLYVSHSKNVRRSLTFNNSSSFDINILFVLK
jgi:hypothetical protein